MKKARKSRRKIRLLIVVPLLFLIAGFGFYEGWKQGEREEHSEKTGLDLRHARLISKMDTHGGFLGDGLSLFIYALEGDGTLEEIKNSPEWKPLPFGKMEEAFLYGVTTKCEDGTEAQEGPYFTDDEGKLLVPRIENGFVKVIDRHSKSDGQIDCETIFERASINLTVMIYDTDENLLYICDMDT